MRHADKDNTLTFEPRGIAKVVREATGRKEYRLRMPQHGNAAEHGAIMGKLVLEVLGGRRCAWRVHYDITAGGKRQRRKLTIGTHATPLDTVNKKWREAVEVIEADGDPVGAATAKRATALQRSEATFSKMVEEYLAAKEKAGRRSVGETRRILALDVLPVVGNKAACEVSALDVERIIETVVGRGSPSAARACHVAVFAVFTWSLGTARWRGAGVVSNPAATITKAAPPQPRTRKLTDAQLRQLWTVLGLGKHIEMATGEALKLCLLLGRRANEVAGARFEEFEDLEGAEPLWRIPASRAKGKREIVIPLTGRALEIVTVLDGLNLLSDQPSKFLFKGAFVSKDTCLSDRVLTTGISRLFKAGLLTGSKYSPHDLRRTLANRCAEKLDFDRETIGALLGHTETSVTDVNYSQSSKLNRTRRLVEAWSSYLLTLVEGQAATRNNVRALRR
ncbi:MAG: tyrosine-type recombinase/integrase [Hyphomicrobium sp.]